MLMKNKILTVNNLSISFIQYAKGLNEKRLNPVKSLSIGVKAGEILAIVGASGSGKSLLAHAVMGILPANAQISGEMFYKDERLDDEKIKALRGKKISFIPQSVNYLDPTMKVKHQVQLNLPKKKKVSIQESLFEKYGLKKSDGDLFPFQLSGGMLRRVLFATSIRDSIELIIADEPTPGIHPELLAVMLTQLKEIADAGVAVILITHDIMSAVKIADNITIFKDGKIIETSPASYYQGEGEKLNSSYAKELWQSLPQNKFMDAGTV